MKTLVALCALVLVTASVAGCAGSSDGDAVATDPAPTAAPAMPAAPPSSPGQVSTRGPATVIDSGAGPQTCLGPMTMIYPPQCTGPALVGWDWKTLGQGMSEEEQATRWGSYALTGTWDGSALTVVGAVPAALYDAAPVPTPTPAPATGHSPAELTAIAATVGKELPGADSAYVSEGRVVVDVTYDDGSLQAWVDQEYGASVVLVSAALIDVG